MSYVHELGRSWGWLLARGIFGVIFGILAVVLPLTTVSALLVFFGIYLIIDALGLLFAAASVARRHRSGRLLLVEGLLTLLAGIVFFVAPGTAAVAMVYVVAIWALVAGAMKMSAGLHFHDSRQHEWTLVTGGLITLLLGLVLLLAPSAGVVIVSWSIGIYALVFGASMITMAWRLHGMTRAAVGVSSTSVEHLAPDQPQLQDEDAEVLRRF